MDRRAVRPVAELEGRRLGSPHLAGQADPQGGDGRRGRGRAADNGADAVVVSNHGGRQLDGALLDRGPALQVVDGGGRSSTRCCSTAACARARTCSRPWRWGAKSCLIGKAFLWSLAAGGEAGVSQALGFIRKELATTMALTGIADVRQIDRKVLR
jgi:L-lactate dehydrogenase (cytochrome)